MNKRLLSLKPYPKTRLDAKKAELAARGVRLFDFGTGDPGDVTPEFIRRALIELGQVLVVLGLVGVLALVPRGRREAATDTPDDERFLAPALVRRVGSAAIAVLGFVWFAQRL